MRRNMLLALAGAGALVAAAITAWAVPDAAEDDLGLFTSLPIFWAEAGSIGEMLDEGGETHWVRAVLEEDYRLVPLDALEDAELDRLDRLVMAQPRPLAPAENVALDAWVRGGGRLVLFADPFLTDHSRYALGDKRRPQDVVLLSPILLRWGLELAFDEAQSESERTVRFSGEPIPIRLAGTLRRATPSAPADCKLHAESVIADCRIGKGRVLVVADASLLELERSPAAAQSPLTILLGHGFGR